ncbi:MAG TPA: right-handed parallel beta-helix repeat-containing protein [Gammaproteobacteria bacterium]|nr:right-handed parallel beta-helix repeat-containing protein [Gammaproteobacteria bacterium]
MRSAIASCLLVGSLLAASAGEAATYYVRAGGNDSADGRSHANAWGSLSAVNNRTFAAGDIVLLHEGDTFYGTLTVNWSGTSTTQPAVVGAYYLKDGVAARGYQNGRPAIDGRNALPSGRYDALLHVTGDRVRVENIKVMNSRGRGIDFLSSDDSWAVNCYVDRVYGSGIQFQSSANAHVQQSYVTHAGQAFKDGATWGSSIEIYKSLAAVVENNLVFENYGEGINAHGGSTATIIQANTVYGVRAVGIYADAAPDTTIRRNIVLGTTNSEYWRSARTVGAGIALNNESYHYDREGLSPAVQTQRARVYDNLVAFTASGVAIWGEYAGSSFDGTVIFNNTFVDNDNQIAVLGTPKPSSKLINNVFLSLSSGTHDVSGGPSLGGMVAKSNYFSQGNPGGDFANAGNRYTGIKLKKMSGWRAISDRTQVTWKDFDNQTDSTSIGAGDDEPSRMASGGDAFQLDFNKTSHNQPMDMGGLKFNLPVVAKMPAAPENLALN